MDPFLGEIKIFAGNYAPQDWLICDGRLVNIADYNALFALLGTVYGGNGATTFALPDLRGRLPIGQGTGVGLTNKPLGSRGGSEGITLTLDQTPMHNHAVKVSKTTTSNVVNPSALTYLGPAVVSGSTGYCFANNFTTGTKRSLDDSALLPYQGGNSAHSNIMPFIALNYIICVANGIYPTAS